MSEKIENANRLVRELIDYSTLASTPEILERLEVLLADFMICVVSGNRLHRHDSLLKKDGAIGLAARLASQSAFEDKDDLDWSAVNHPGSVVFATSFAIALEHPQYRDNFLTSALAECAHPHLLHISLDQVIANVGTSLQPRELVAQ